MIRRDKLGRKIPDYDRSAARKRGAKTRLKHDKKAFSKMGKKGGPASTPGYFGRLALEDPEKLKEISRRAVEAKKAKRSERGEA